ncbi:PAS domain-containing protein [Pontibacter oryzae]|uniref:histidine kinase n=1 Tax=Pontibacter oryzae TaxID=2304593 RepID=A0A399RZK4_9BACT|nr:PAS domain-containing protein [Pontibacter oryzae]RIJ37370.1 PAS domain S-box protein [Pontibacter oryzae]
MNKSNQIAPPAFDVLFHALPGLYLLMTPDFYVVDTTDAYLRAALLTRNQIIGQYIFDVFPNNPENPGVDSESELKRSLELVLESKQVQTMSVIQYDIVDHISHKNRFLQRYWRSSNTPILDDKNDICYILHETSDITELMQLQQREQHITEHLTALAQAVNAVNREYNLETKTIRWGKGLRNILGYTPEEIGTQLESWTARIHPGDLPRVVTGLTEAMKGKVWTAQYRFKKASGHYAHFLDQGYIMHDRHGNGSKMLSSMIDISASKKAEQALSDSNDRFLKLIEALPQMAWTADPKGKILHFNKNWYTYTGMLHGQTEGWLNMVHPDDCPLVITAWKEAQHSGFYQIECRVKCQLDGSYQWFFAQTVPIRNNAGEVIYWLGTMTDMHHRSVFNGRSNN